MTTTAAHDHLNDLAYVSERYSECNRCGALIDWQDEEDAAAPALIETVRTSDAKLAGIERNIRLGRYQGRNSRATEAVATTAERRIDTAIRRLLDAGEREVVGLLTAEMDLRRRISRSRDEGTDRPELRARLAQVRRSLKAARRAARVG